MSYSKFCFMRPRYLRAYEWDPSLFWRGPTYAPFEYTNAPRSLFFRVYVFSDIFKGGEV